MADKVKALNLLIVDFGFNTGKVFGPLFPEVAIYRHPPQVNENSVLLFEGGNDIPSELYSEKPGSWTHIPNWKRDDFEVSIFHMARHRHAAGFIGICRGAQLLTALSGGKLFQDVDGHESSHLIKTDTGKMITTTSLHHQMMNPFVLPEKDFQLVAWSATPKASYYLDSTDTTTFVPEKEPEVVWYPKTKSLCIQGHPEFAPKDGTFVQYCQALVNRFIINESPR